MGSLKKPKEVFLTIGMCPAKGDKSINEVCSDGPPGSKGRFSSAQGHQLGSHFTPGPDVSALGHRDLCYGIKRN